MKLPISLLTLLAALALSSFVPTSARAREDALALLGNPAVSRIQTSQAVWALTLSGRRVYSVDSNLAFYVGFYQVSFEVFDLMDSAKRGSLPDISFSPCVAEDHGFAYLGGLDFRVLDVSDPTAPRIVGTHPATDYSEYVQDIAVVRPYAYAASLSGLRIFDVSDPTSPTPIASLAIGEASAVAVRGPFAYIAAGPAGIVVVDVSNPGAPAVAGTCDLPAGAWDIELRGSHAYVPDGAGLRVLDIANPNRLRLIGGVDTPFQTSRVALSGARAYLPGASPSVEYGTSLQVVDISNPTRPAIVNSIPGTIESDGYWQLWARFQLVSASDGRVVVGGALTHQWLGDCIGGLFGCDYSTGFLDLGFASSYEPPPSASTATSSPDGPRRDSSTPLPATFDIAGIAPNPFTGKTTIHFHLARASQVRIAVYDTRGRLVETLADRLFQPGPHETAWQGRDATGQMVTSGVYFVTIDSEGARKTRKLALVR